MHALMTYITWEQEMELMSPPFPGFPLQSESNSGLQRHTLSPMRHDLTFKPMALVASQPKQQ
jgi:hypothetical protein